MSKRKQSIEAQAREVAAHHGYLAIPSTKRSLPANAGGGFMLVHAETNVIKAGRRFDMSAEQVLAFFEEGR